MDDGPIEAEKNQKSFLWRKHGPGPGCRERGFCGFTRRARAPTIYTLIFLDASGRSVDGRCLDRRLFAACSAGVVSRRAAAVQGVAHVMQRVPGGASVAAQGAWQRRFKSSVARQP